MIQYRVVHGPKSLVADGLRTPRGTDVDSGDP
jgi:hypothetical protein